MSKTLPIVALLARFELAEAVLRLHGYSPPRPPEEPGRPATPTDWEIGHKAKHDALNAAQSAAIVAVKGWMEIVGKIESHEADEAGVAMAIRNLTYFNSWLSLRGALRWGDDIRAPNLAASLEAS